MDLRTAWRHVVPTPDRYRRLIRPATALAILRSPGLDPASIPGGVEVGGQTFFDAADMYNLGLYSRSRITRPEVDMHYLGRAIRRTDWASAIQYSISVEAACPRAAECDGGDWKPLDIVGATWVRSGTEPGRVAYLGQGVRTGASALIRDPRISDLWRHMLGGYRFHFGPDELSARIAYTYRRKVGSCLGLSLALARHLEHLGIAAETRRGFLMCGGSAAPHAWVELHDVDGREKAVDPSLACLSPLFFTQRYADFCLGGTFNRTLPLRSGHDGKLRHHCGGEVLHVTPRVKILRVRV
jgi:hypothetical protein